MTRRNASLLLNLRYLKMYDLSPDVVKPGITLREIIAHRARIGQVVGNPDTFCDIIRKNAQRRRFHAYAGN